MVWATIAVDLSQTCPVMETANQEIQSFRSQVFMLKLVPVHKWTRVENVHEKGENMTLFKMDSTALDHLVSLEMFQVEMYPPLHCVSSTLSIKSVKTARRIEFQLQMTALVELMNRRTCLQLLPTRAELPKFEHGILK